MRPQILMESWLLSRGGGVLGHDLGNVCWNGLGGWYPHREVRQVSDRGQVLVFIAAIAIAADGIWISRRTCGRRTVTAPKTATKGRVRGRAIARKDPPERWDWWWFAQNSPGVCVARGISLDDSRRSGHLEQEDMGFHVRDHC